MADDTMPDVPALLRAREAVDPGYLARSTDPAAIRYNNPGAQWPAKESPQYGMTGYGVIGGNNKIAQFPTPELGAAANMDLLSRRYVGMTIGDAAKKWSNSGYSSVAGFDPKTVITPELVKDPAFAIPFFKSISRVEAGKPYPMSDAQWQAAHQTFLAGGTGASNPPGGATPAPSPGNAPSAAPAYAGGPSQTGAVPVAPENAAGDNDQLLQTLQALSKPLESHPIQAPPPQVINYPVPAALAKARALAAAMQARPIGGA